jgi:hypothetical protein
MLMKNFAITCFGLASILALSACSSGGDVETTVAGGGRGGTEYGFITLSVTDAPIDYATEVWVQFDGVEFMPSSESTGQTPILINFDTPMSINLLELQGTNSRALLTNEVLPTGKYDWVKLNITAANDGILDSYIVMEDGTVHELDMPSGSDMGLTIIGGLEVIANMPSAKTIDFDLRKSIVMNNLNEYQIQPAINLVSNDRAGAIEGSIKLKELISPNCSDFNPLTGNAVYLYEGFNITPDDIDGTGPEPIHSALVKLNQLNGKFEFSFGFVPFGKYTATFTCEADLDDQSTDDVISFTTTKNVNITSTQAISLKSNTFR